jgi:hypothetical protein
MRAQVIGRRHARFCDVRDAVLSNNLLRLDTERLSRIRFLDVGWNIYTPTIRYCHRHRADRDFSFWGTEAQMKLIEICGPFTAEGQCVDHLWVWLAQRRPPRDSEPAKIS